MPTHRIMITVRRVAARSVVNLYPSVPEPTASSATHSPPPPSSPLPQSVSPSSASASASQPSDPTIPAPAFWAVLACLAFLILLITLIPLAWCCHARRKNPNRTRNPAPPPSSHHDLKAESGYGYGYGYSGPTAVVSPTTATARSFFPPFLTSPSTAYFRRSQSSPDLRSPFAHGHGLGLGGPHPNLDGNSNGRSMLSLSLNPNHRDMRERIQELGNANPSLLGVIFEDPDPNPDPSTVTQNSLVGRNGGVEQQQQQQQQRRWGGAAHRVLGMGRKVVLTPREVRLLASDRSATEFSRTPESGLSGLTPSPPGAGGGKWR
ncbi:MAG: hypothetical protein LQ342_001107 [Letrouitia transgressa]|nr:MAG: hypothetical protein LQ342_001107 [Letrouitia transgressa]